MLKTTTVRLPDDQIELLEAFAQAMGCRTSDVHRLALSEFMSAHADDYPQVIAARDALIDRAIADRAEELRRHIGTSDRLTELSAPDD